MGLRAFTLNSKVPSAARSGPDLAVSWRSCDENLAADHKERRAKGVADENQLGQKDGDESQPHTSGE
jgi:hypothetical protein